MPGPRKTPEERKAIVQAAQARQRRADRRRAWLIWGSGAVLVLSLVAAVAFVLVGEVQQREQIKAEAARPVEGEQEFPDQSRNHTSQAVSYPRTPATGGDHAPVWTNCGVYTAPVKQTQAVHSLEHGAVWISYRPDLPKDQIDQLATLTGGQEYLLLSPVQEQSSPVMATAWGKQLSLDGSADGRLPAFIKKYAQGPQTPEPGAPCTGGVPG